MNIKISKLIQEFEKAKNNFGDIDVKILQNEPEYNNEIDFYNINYIKRSLKENFLYFTH